jgi:hypothetical protein
VWPLTSEVSDGVPLPVFVIVAVPFATVPGPNETIFVPGALVMSSNSA